MNEEARKQVVQKLDELREQVAERLGKDPANRDAVAAHVEELRAIVEEAPSGEKKAHSAAGHLEQRLLAWEAEHPQLTMLASRIARALEDSGL